MNVLPLPPSFSNATLPKFSMYCKVTSMNMERKTNYYKILALESESVGYDEIKKAYRTMARRYHPDVCPNSKKDESTRMFVELHRAYETLSNPTLREMYDIELRMIDSGLARANMVQPKHAKERWEAQLCELRRRSEDRQRVMMRRTRII